MKLEFAYFDFTNADQSKNAYRGLGECALNFSTTHDYSVKWDEEKRSYMITCAEKPKNNRIPKDFWGNDIYNITALVGDNGSGKSTILHNLIRCLLQAMDGNEVKLRPSFPFCIIYLDESDKPHSYCDKSSKFSGLDFVGNIEYPGCFQKLKCMLIDNTITLSSSKFDNLVYKFCPRVSSDNNHDYSAFEQKHQLFNKSLAASIRSNCYLSTMKDDGNTYRNSNVVQYLNTHLNYESYQELRFILNRKNYEMLEELRNDGYHVPVPDEVDIYIYSLPTDVVNLANELNYFDYPLKFLIGHIKKRGRYDYDEPQKLIDLIIQNVDYFAVKDYNRVSISLKGIFDDKPRYEFFSEFLDKYRSIVGGEYFLTFSFGLSSGEKNILKMLTQFNYVIDGKRYSKDKERGEDRIINLLPGKGEVECDTLVLFFDEADLTYHPEWQRSFVSILSAVLPKMFGEYISDIQVILATHSPLMLSDFPDASSIYLKRGADGLVRCENSGNTSTFAQNLYFILRDGFFLNDSIGEFAKNKINEVAEWCWQVVEMDALREKLNACGFDYRKYKDEMKKLYDSISKSKNLAYKEWLGYFKDKDKLKSFFDEREAEFEQKRQIVRLLPDGLIKGKLISDIERTEEVFLRYGICNKEKLKERKEWLEKELEKIKNMKGILD